MTKKIILSSLVFWVSFSSFAQDENTLQYKPNIANSTSTGNYSNMTHTITNNTNNSSTTINNSPDLTDKNNILINGLNSKTLSQKETTPINEENTTTIDITHIKYVDSTDNSIGNHKNTVQQINVDMDKIKQNPIVSVDIQIVQKSHTKDKDIIKLDSSLITYSGMPNGLSYDAPNRLINPVIHADYLEAAPDISQNIHNNTLLDNTISYSLTPLVHNQNVELNGVINFYIISAKDVQVAEKHNVNVTNFTLMPNETKQIDLNADYYLNFTYSIAKK
jgi:hypothetical protein